ncbi:MAG: hypothetical protein PHW60_14055 [Kiritimatiellae bacterium]|nr:hypothetical protein [Kiritimatiellia bacterium]
METKLNERLVEWLMGRSAAAPRAESDRAEIQAYADDERDSDRLSARFFNSIMIIDI